MINGTYRYHPQGAPIPEGWEYVGELAGHHAYYSCLIRKI